jgi:FAD binding domain-containing protein/D-arabinono-1,4-lactone oxidase
MEYASRAVWYNHSRNQSILPLRIFRPSRLEDVVAIVQDAEHDGVTARAVGSHHAWSDAALTTGYTIETHGLNRVLELETDLLRSGMETRTLVRTEAGIRLRELNAALDRKGLALVQMGGFDEQTVGGVLSTATHGSGMKYGPIADYVVSLDVVGSGGQLYRIEPADGPTDRDKFAQRYPAWQLRQSDEWFDAARVGVGCLGVVYAVVLRVRELFYLKERRFLRPWSTVRRELLDGAILRESEHYEVYLNPHPTLPGGDHQCLITTRVEIPKPTGKTKAQLHRNWLTEIGGDSRFVAWLIKFLYDHFPRWTPRVIDFGLKGLKDREYSNVSYRVYDIGTPNYLPAVSSEIGVPVDFARNTHVAAVDEVLRIAAKWRAEGNVYHSSPISLRFVKQSTASLAMMEGRDTMMMELILFHPTTGGNELLAAYEEALSKLDGRPHWGQINYLAGDRAELIAAYPRYPEWEAVHGQLNATGVFNSPFSKRVGIVNRAVLP